MRRLRNLPLLESHSDISSTGCDGCNHTDGSAADSGVECGMSADAAEAGVAKNDITDANDVLLHVEYDEAEAGESSDDQDLRGQDSQDEVKGREAASYSQASLADVPSFPAFQVHHAGQGARCLRE